MSTVLVQHASFCAIYNFCTIEVYDSLYCAFRPMKYVESDVMWYNVTYDKHMHTLLATDIQATKAKTTL